MICSLRSFGLEGIRGYEVSVEADISQGLPAFDVVGLPDMAVREARERIRAAIKNSGFKYPVSRITINLAPAGTKKSGTLYDVPMLVGILAAMRAVPKPEEDCAFVGELSLDGQVRPVNGVLPMAMSAASCGIRRMFVPAENAAEASLAGNVSVYPVKNVQQLAAHLRGESFIEPAPRWEAGLIRRSSPDFSDVKGQDTAKRALEIAAAGGHNILMVGPPGSGKSMLARRLPSILPDMSREEELELTTVYSVAGKLPKDQPLLTERPFRSPHHTVSMAGLVGGGSNPRPGEISLAHHGVLFLDELPEFGGDTLDVLRQPLEERQVTISRVSGTVEYPSNFMLVCAMNPCKCGWYGHPSGKCRCSRSAVDRYLSRVSGPLLDRIDMIIEVQDLPFDELRSTASAERSSDIRVRVNAAREIQRRRYREEGLRCNSEMQQKQLRAYCLLDDGCTELMRQAFDSLGLTARSYDRILRVARTIADLDGAEFIGVLHLAEAIRYRTFQLERN
ncbi:MAG: YifB family Mg chelatase-like AAA ATPase [Oscillospiraceae bacterium]|nr:YifB family Mg chelatase-like AAA ATPase [Oscillospiraceae bacterium]